MPNLNPNSTNYVHSHEPNTNDLVQAMDYDPYGRPIIRIDDTTKQHTSKNRVKVSVAEVIDYATFQYSEQDDVWDTQVTGTATYARDPYLNMVKLEVGGTAGDKIVRQTKRVQRYIPGRMNEVSMAVIFGTPTTGIRKRYGLFDDAGGIYFEDGGDGNYYCVIRRTGATGVEEIRVAREDWTVDKLDGTGPSGIVADPTKIHLMDIEYEWYGAGQVEWNFIINNNKYPIHQHNTANVYDHSWTNTPFLPVRVELENVAGTAGTHTFYQGSHSLTAEGELRTVGRASSISNAITGYNLGNTANVWKPLVSIKLKASQLNGVVIPTAFTAATLDNTGIFVRIVVDDTITGGTWVGYDGNDSPVQYNITATGTTGGEILQTLYISQGNQGNVFAFEDRSITQLYRKTTTTLGDTPVNFTLQVACPVANKTAWANLQWMSIR